MNVARFQMVGRVVNDPEIKATQAGLKVCKVRVAVNDGRRNEEHSSFYSVAIFGNAADTVAKYVLKGQRMMFWGRFQENRWETKEGEKRTKIEFLADGFQFGAKPKGAENRETQQQQTWTAPEPEARPQFLDDDLPF